MTTLAGPAATTLGLLDELFQGIEFHDFAVRLWDGTLWTPGPAGDPAFTLLSIGDTLMFAEKAAFDVRDVENLREHYGLTLRRWVAALEASHEAAAAEVGEPTWRAWHITFAGAALDIERGSFGLLQALLVKPCGDGSAEVPLGRWDWYENG